MKDKISKLIDRREAIGERIEKLAQLNEFHNSALISGLKRRWIVLDKKISAIWE
jgi:hypothetical protein